MPFPNLIFKELVMNLSKEVLLDTIIQQTTSDADPELMIYIVAKREVPEHIIKRQRERGYAH